MYTQRQPKVDVKCSGCSTVFTRHAYYVRLKRARNGGKLYCSNSCSKRARFGGVRQTVIACLQCGKKKAVAMWQATRRKQRVFCGKRCANLWRSINLAGDKSPNWKGGKVHSYGRSGWKKIRIRIRRRDSQTCQCCSVKWRRGQRRFDVHHIKAFDLFENPIEANLDSNLVTLCRLCHAKFHPLYTGSLPAIAKASRRKVRQIFAPARQREARRRMVLA